ncbi:MAG TPA: peptidylprolyl isomerase [Opitutaceae bacterium]|nr:peptidylprolyl isomerase [Opitutaceae bacterium]
MRITQSLLVFFTLVFLSFARAQSTMPAVANAIPAQALTVAGAPVSLDLRTVFALPGVTGQIAQFDTVLGRFNAELLAADAPRTVANFLNYVNRGAYAGTFVHRSVPGFVVQGGGFALVGNAIGAVLADPAVANEFKDSNVRGTIAMAKSPSGPDTATSQWFINLADNGGTLDSQNGGATVFARVLGTGMSVADAIAALNVYDASGQLGASFTQLPLRSATLTADNLAVVRSINLVPAFPDGVGASVLTFSVDSSDSSVATAAVAGSALAITPRGAGNASVAVHATDTNGNTATTTIAVSVAPGPTFTSQPASQSSAAGGSIVLSAAASGATNFQWQRNGIDVAGATSPTLTIDNLQPGQAGAYVLLARNGSAIVPSQPAVVGIEATSKVVGAATELEPHDIRHPNGNIYDQVLLTGPAATITADPGQITRLSFVDPNDDIVQVEFSGAGALTLTLDDFSPAAPPKNYNQPGVNYVKGRASIVIAGASDTTYVSVFSVGRANAVNQGLFIDSVAYDGVADLASLSILSPSGKIGGIFTGNVNYSAARGLAGIYAPGVSVVVRAAIGDVSASGSAMPVLVFGGVGDARIAGGDLLQANARAVQVEGIAQLQFTAGTNSHAAPIGPQPNRGLLEHSGADVTAQVAKIAE